MHVIVFAALAVVGFALHVAFFERPRRPERWIEIALLYFFAVIVGGGGIFSFTGHTLVADGQQIG